MVFCAVCGVQAPDDAPRIAESSWCCGIECAIQYLVTADQRSDNL